jgi:hypothetical protein
MPFKIKFKKIIILGPTPYNHYHTPIFTLEIGALYRFSYLGLG